MLIQAPTQGARLATAYGHVMLLHPNEQRELEGAMLQLAISQGCALITGNPAMTDVKIEQSDEERQELIRAAIDELIDRGREEDFTSAGMPRVREVAVIIGDEVTKDEVETVFNSMKA